MVWARAEKDIDAPIRRIKSIIVEGKRSQGTPRRTWEEKIKIIEHLVYIKS